MRGLASYLAKGGLSEAQAAITSESVAYEHRPAHPLKGFKIGFPCGHIVPVDVIKYVPIHLPYGPVIICEPEKSCPRCPSASPKPR